MLVTPTWLGFNDLGEFFLEWRDDIKKKFKNTSHAKHLKWSWKDYCTLFAVYVHVALVFTIMFDVYVPRASFFVQFYSFDDFGFRLKNG